MSSEKSRGVLPDRFAFAQWILERHLHWISLVETKTAVIVPIDAAMMAALGVAFCELSPTARPAWGIFFCILAGAGLAGSIAYSAAAVWPQTKGPDTSFIFFGKVANFKADQYAAQFLAATERELIEDCLAQIHRNAQIAHDKYSSLAISLKLGFISLPVWLIAVWMLVAAQP